MPCEWSPDFCKTFLCTCFSFLSLLLSLPLYLLANFFSMLVVGKPFFCNGPDSCRRPCISEGGCLRIDAAAKSLPSCLTLCDLMYCSPPGSSVHGILEARVWNGFLCSSSQDLPDQRSNPCLLHLLLWQVGSLPLAPPGKPLNANGSLLKTKRTIEQIWRMGCGLLSPVLDSGNH